MQQKAGLGSTRTKMTLAPLKRVTTKIVYCYNYLQCPDFEMKAQGRQSGTEDNGITPCMGHTTLEEKKRRRNR